ncbi:MAG: hypothetical protein Edafosvirus10_9 [Edafosvirus sp.]|uniref:Uncharacterized protein n=1 Tax=Edafosvirus sp. TaxID=2487765 RepID=A0A3G4ZVH2_9VIRU|nr:MAG: hypothetical protein Edafosvirus10_9 [Edafosvirus sp.]
MYIYYIFQFFFDYVLFTEKNIIKEKIEKRLFINQHINILLIIK